MREGGREGGKKGVMEGGREDGREGEKAGGRGNLYRATNLVPTPTQVRQINKRVVRLRMKAGRREGHKPGTHPYSSSTDKQTGS